MGWLGWSEEQTLSSDVNAILVAYDGMVRRLNAEKGIDPDKSDTTPDGKQRIVVGGDQKPKLTPAAFDAMFGAGPPHRRGIQQITSPPKAPRVSHRPRR